MVSIHSDKFRCWILSLSLFLIRLVVSASWYSVYLSKHIPSHFILSLLLIAAALVFAFSVFDWLFFYIAFELTFIPIAYIILKWGANEERVLAFNYILFFTVLSTTLIILALLFNYSYYFSANIKTIFYGRSSLILLAILIPLLVKTPIFALHQWLPKAHVEAPVGGRILLAGIILKIGSYGIIRLLPSINISNTALDYYIIPFSLVGGALASVVALAQNDIKAVIAYASVGHICFSTAAVFSLYSISVNAFLILIIRHAFVRSGLFA